MDLFSLCVTRALDYSSCALGVIVFAIASCRIGVLRIRKHKLSWLLVYFFFAVGATIIVLDVVKREHATWGAVALLTGTLILLWNSRVTWKRDAAGRIHAPDYLEKDHV